VALSFESEDDLVKWLVTTNEGRSAMRDAAFTPGSNWLWDEVADRRRVYVLIKAYADGYIEVHADRTVSARVVELPTPNTKHEEHELEAHVHHAIPWCYRDVDYPGMMATTGKVRPLLSMAKWRAGLQKVAETLRIVDLLSTVASRRSKHEASIEQASSPQSGGQGLASQPQEGGWAVRAVPPEGPLGPAGRG
jgi:hypothetical protein